MKDSKYLAECKYCEEQFCIHCSNAESPQDYCDIICEEAARAEAKADRANMKQEYMSSRGV